jgi:hypothetical protein
MNKKAIQGLAFGASGHNAAKPSGLGRRVDGPLARWKLVFLSGEASSPGGVGFNLPRRRSGPPGDRRAMGREESAEGVVAA